MGVSVKTTLRELPSKARVEGGRLIPPFPYGWQEDKACLSAGQGLFWCHRRHQVLRATAPTIWLFDMSRSDKTRPFIVQVSQQTFVTRMHALCRGTSPVIRYEGLKVMLTESAVAIVAFIWERRLSKRVRRGVG